MPNLPIYIGIGEGVRSWSSLSPERHHFSSARKKKLWCIKSIPNDIVECMEQGFYKKIHPITCLRWSGDQVLFWPSVPLKSYFFCRKVYSHSLTFSPHSSLHHHALQFWVASETQIETIAPQLKKNSHKLQLFGFFNIRKSGTFCSFFKFSLHINPNALKWIAYQNNPYIYLGYSFQASKMLQ